MVTKEKATNVAGKEKKVVRTTRRPRTKAKAKIESNENENAEIPKKKVGRPKGSTTKTKKTVDKPKVNFSATTSTDKVDKRAFNHYDILKGDYSHFNLAEVAEIMKHSFINIKAKSQRMPGMMDYFTEKEHMEILVNLIRYNETLDFEALRAKIDQIEEKQLLRFEKEIAEKSKFYAKKLDRIKALKKQK